MQPGETILKQKIADEFKLSQGPVRDAILRLQVEDLVEVIPQSKTSVTLIDAQNAHDIHFLRLSVELEVVRSLAITVKELEINLLSNLVERLEFELKAGDRLTFKERDSDFHEELFRLAGVENLFGLIRSRRGHYDRLRGLYLMDTERRKEVVEDHKNILQGLVSGDPEIAVEALRLHLGKSLAVIPEIQNKYPTYCL